MASLFTRNGIHYAEFFDSTRTPKAKRISLRTKRKAEARKRLSELEQDQDRGTFDPWYDDPATYKQDSAEATRILDISAALETFLEAKRGEGKAPSTTENYRTFCAGLIRLVGQNKPFHALKPSVVEAYVQDDTVAAATRATRYRHVRAWLRWCHKKGFTRSVATDQVAPPRNAEKMPKAVRVEDMEAIEAAIRTDYAAKWETGEIDENDLIWMIPLFWFALYTGLRASELARLRWGHIDFERDLINIYEQKNGKEQTIPLIPPARRVLEAMEAGAPDQFVFCATGSDPYTRNVKSFRCNLARKFKRYAEAAGITRRITPHGLRHGFCTVLAEAGKSAPIIKAAARHADISTSMKYVHIANTALKAELAGVFD